MAISNLLTGRVRVVTPKNVTADRYQFLDLSQAEPNFGVPTFSASLYDNPAILVSDSDGNRGFIQFAPTAKQIGSGSATASISPNLGLQINVDTTIAGNLYVSKSIVADQLIVNIISSSVIYSSGSNIFGDELTDVQQFTGSVEVRDRIGVNQITGSSISSSFTGSFFGDGSNLFNLPQATRLASGSVTASVAPEYGFKIESQISGSQFTGSVYITGSVIVTGSIKAQEITGSISGSFTGDGAGLFNIPRSAFSGDAFRIASGSVTASVDPAYGFKVESQISGSEITGSVKISGSLFITAVSGALVLGSSSAYYGEGTYLRNIPRNALSEDALISTEIKSGSVTASVSPNFGFVVQSVASGSQFTGSIKVSGSVIAQFYFGDGSNLLNVPSTVAPRIASGSVTASISPNLGLVVNTFSTFQFGVSASMFTGSGAGLFDIPRSAIVDDASRIASGSVTASVAPDYGFKVNAGAEFSGSVRVSGSIYAESGSYFVGDGSNLTNITLANLSIDSTKIFSGSATASISPNLGFKVNTFSKFDFPVSASMFSGSGRGLFDIPLSALAPDALISTLIATGSITASVSPQYGFRVQSFVSGSEIASQFTGSLSISGSIEINSGSSYSGSGARLFDIPIKALKDLDLTIKYNDLCKLIKNAKNKSEIKQIWKTNWNWGSLKLPVFNAMPLNEIRSHFIQIDYIL